MILFYSASGNTEFLAKRLARYLEDDCIDLLPRIREGNYSEIYSKKPYVILCPVYVSAIPEFVRKLIMRTPLKGNKKIYFVFTNAGATGISGEEARRIVQRKHMIFRGYASVQMPNNYVISPYFPMTESRQARIKIAEAREQAKKIAVCVLRDRSLSTKRINPVDVAITILVNQFWTRFNQPVKKYYTTDACIGCGTCARICPLKNIDMQDGRPVWKNPCAHCMACISNCPVDAIQYGTITQKRKTYHISHYIKKSHSREWSGAASHRRKTVL